MHRAPGPRVCGLSPRGGAREARAPGQARPSPFALHRGPRHQLLTGRTPGLKEAPSLLTWQTGVTQRDTEGLRCPLTRPGGLPLPPPALTPAAAEGRKVPHTHLARGSAVRRSCTVRCQAALRMGRDTPEQGSLVPRPQTGTSPVRKWAAWPEAAGEQSSICAGGPSPAPASPPRLRPRPSGVRL